MKRCGEFFGLDRCVASSRWVPAMVSTALAHGFIEMFRKARAEGISVAPGPLFSTEGGFRNHIRINCGYRWSGRIERAGGVLGNLAQVLSHGRKIREVLSK